MLHFLKIILVSRFIVMQPMQWFGNFDTQKYSGRFQTRHREKVYQLINENRFSKY